MSASADIIRPPWLSADDPNAAFPPIQQALADPDGLLCAGADLSVKRLLQAYSAGIFPWYNADQPILWWSPDPRTVLPPTQIKVSRSLKKQLRKHPWRVTADSAFAQVIQACSAPRATQQGTWIVPEMQAAYIQLHEAGYAHSIEVWLGQELVGGLYGVSLGRAFFGESMFSRASDASKVALLSLCEQLKRWHFELLDCQVSSEHLLSLGAHDLPRDQFQQQLQQCLQHSHRKGVWHLDEQLLAAWQ